MSHLIAHNQMSHLIAHNQMSHLIIPRAHNIVKYTIKNC